MTARDWFDLPDSDENPAKRAQALARRTLPKRFYKIAAVDQCAEGFCLALDDRRARTPGRNLLAFSRRPLAEAVAREWQDQAEVIDPARMPLTRLANSAIDGVAREMEVVTDEIEKFAGSDLLYYRAEQPEILVEMQRRAWDPLIAWIEQAGGIRLALGAGIVHVEQEPAALAALRGMVEKAAAGDPLRLAALHAITSLTGSAILALALAEGGISTDAAWEAAHIDEDFQMQQWGEDSEALKRRAFRQGEFQAGVFVLAATANI